MAILISEIPDAVAAELAFGAFSKAFTAERAFVPAFIAEDLADLRVVVAPNSIKTTLASRGSNTTEAVVDIGVLKRVENDLSQVEELIGLVDEIRAFLNRRALGAMPLAIWKAEEVNPIYSTDELKNNRVFVSVIRITYFIGS